MVSIKRAAVIVCSITMVVSFTVTLWGESVAAGAPARSTPIPIGFMCDCTGIYSSNLAAWGPGIQAWAKWTDAHGGIQGHSVKIFEIDTHSNTADYSPAFRQLTQADHVVAIIPGIGGGTDLAPYASATAPIVGGVQEGGETDFVTNPYMFPNSTTGGAIVPDILGVAVKSGHKKVAVIGPAGSGATFPQLFNPVAPTVGAQFIGSAETPDAAPNYDAQCLSFQGRGANAVILATDAATIIRFTQDCVSQSYRPTYVAPSQTVTQAMTTMPALNGLLILQTNLPYYSKSPAAANFDAAMKRYESGFLRSSLNGDGSILAWISGQMLIAAIAAVHPKGAITSSEIIDGMYKFRAVTLGGLVPPLTFIRGQPKNVPCYFIGGISGGKFTTPLGPKPFCSSK